MYINKNKNCIKITFIFFKLRLLNKVVDTYTQTGGKFLV